MVVSETVRFKGNVDAALEQSDQPGSVRRPTLMGLGRRSFSSVSRSAVWHLFPHPLKRRRKAPAPTARTERGDLVLRCVTNPGAAVRLRRVASVLRHSIGSNGAAARPRIFIQKGNNYRIRSSVRRPTHAMKHN